MFYLCLISGIFIFMAICTQLFLLAFGLIPNAITLIMLLAMEAAVVSLMIRYTKQEHNTYDFVKLAGACIFYFGLFKLFGFKPGLNFYTLFRAEWGLALSLTGMLLYYYNTKRDALEAPKATAYLEEDIKDPIFDLIFELESILALESLPLEFRKNLEDTEDYLLEIQNRKIRVSKAFLSEVANIFERYRNLSAEPIITEEIIETLLKIEDLSADIKEAFEVIYSEDLKIETDKVNRSVEAVNSYIQLNGLTNKISH